VRIGEKGRLSVSVISPDYEGALNPLDLSAFITDLPTGADRANIPSNVFPSVVIEPGSNITMLDLWNPITLFRQGRTDITVDLPASVSGLNHLEVKVPWESSDPNTTVKPNPLMLVVKVMDDNTLTLNNERAGKLDDPGPLGTRLKDIFREREKYGVFRPGTNEIEKTVAIVMPMSPRKIEDLTKIVRVIQAPGGGPIELLMDDPVNTVTERLELLVAPPIPKKRP